MKLKTRELPAVMFRRVLPEYLGPGGECFIEFDARAGGAANPVYLAAMERALYSARAMDARAGAQDDMAGFGAASAEAAKASAKARLAALYDGCVIVWRSNIIDGDAPLVCDRGNFLELANAGVIEIARALLDLEQQVLDAGADAMAQTEATTKN